jgi:CubicO group peptidase (beta-lactamase class C family)
MKILKPLLVCTVGIAAWGTLAVYLAFYGVWMSSAAAQGDENDFYGWAVNEIKSKNAGSSALVLLNDGQVKKQHFKGPRNSIDADTLFPTASYSKWVTAISVMSLVESDQLDLDAPVASYLTRWQLPVSQFDNNAVTVRRLLSHTAGLTDGLGFGDYGAEETLPLVEDELRSPRASSGREVEVKVGIEPGTEFLYSGGGYLILQLVVEEVSGINFAHYVQREVLDPLGMTRSSFAYLAELDNISASYYMDGTVAPTFQYASPAATGFVSSAADLTKLAKAMLSPTNGVPLQSSTIEAMRKPHGFMMGSSIWGLGTILYAPTPGGDYVFGHDGANDPAINSSVRLNPETSDGIVLLVSGHPSLASAIGSEWVLWQTGYPDFLQTERVLQSALVPIVIGGFGIALAVVIWSVRRRKVAR